MSKEMQALFQQMNRFAPATDKPPETSKELQSLWDRVETQRWKEWSLIALQQLLIELDGELAVIEHVLGCPDECQLIWVMNVERYMGTRLPWYLNLCNDVGPFYPDCPKVEDYEFGSYWHDWKNLEKINAGLCERTEGKAITFVLARLKWAKTLMSKEFAAGPTLDNILVNWDIEQGISGQSLTEMLNEIAGIETNDDVIMEYA